MKDKLINPTGLINGNMDNFLMDLGIQISNSPDEYQMTTFRLGLKLAIYGFKTLKDCKEMANFLIDNDIAFDYREKSTGARYEYHLILKRQ